MGTVRVLIADDHKLVRDGWNALLDRALGISVIGQAKDGREAVERAQQLQPDVILMDVNMPRLDGLQATLKIVAQQPGVKILMVTQSLDETLVGTAIQNGALGYLTQNDAFDELVPAILSLQAGQPYISKTVREQYPHAFDAPRRSRSRHYEWQDAAWATLDQNLERAIADASASQDRAYLICQESQTLCAQLRATRSTSHQLLQRRHFEAVVGA